MTDAQARPAFEPLNDLERLLVAATGGGAVERDAFARALPGHELWVALSSEPAPGPDIVRLRSVPQKEGPAATAVFTARERVLATCGPDAEAVGYPGRDLLQSIRANPAVLNPGHGHGVRWSPDAIALLLDQPNPARVRRMPTHLATPAETPPGLVEALTRELSSEPAIKAAWLALARWPGSEVPGFLLDIRAVPTENPIPALINRALEGVTLDARLDVVVGSPDEAPGTGIEVVGGR